MGVSRLKINDLMKKQSRISFYSLFLILSVITITTSCISPRETNLLQQKDPIYPTKGFEEYKIQVNDELNCVILTSNTELANSFNGILTSASDNRLSNRGNRYYVVHENGYIYIPYLSDIYVLNMTVNEAEDVIQRKMKASFPDAQVRLRLRNNIFYVVANKKSGTFNVSKENMTIYQAIALSGNVDGDIDLSKVKIVRHENGKDIVKTFNLKTESVIESEFYYIKPNDVIYYSTSKGSFFKANSVGSFISTILTPILFLGSMIALKDKL